VRADPALHPWPREPSDSKRKRKRKRKRKLLNAHGCRTRLGALDHHAFRLTFNVVVTGTGPVGGQRPNEYRRSPTNHLACSAAVTVSGPVGGRRPVTVPREDCVVVSGVQLHFLHRR
jgi:hypothetical protein